jgi:F-box protein 9
VPLRPPVILYVKVNVEGLNIGTWHLDATADPPLVYVSNLVDRGGGVARSARYVFKMTLGLRSRPLGRWNKLDFIRYDSVAVEVSLGVSENLHDTNASAFQSGEITPFSLKSERPFWFSKVRSYGIGVEL